MPSEQAPGVFRILNDKGEAAASGKISKKRHRGEILASVPLYFYDRKKRMGLGRGENCVLAAVAVIVLLLQLTFNLCQLLFQYFSLLFVGFPVDLLLKCFFLFPQLLNLPVDLVGVAGELLCLGCPSSSLPVQYRPVGTWASSGMYWSCLGAWDWGFGASC